MRWRAAVAIASVQPLVLGGDTCAAGAFRSGMVELVEPRNGAMYKWPSVPVVVHSNSVS